MGTPDLGLICAISVLWRRALERGTQRINFPRIKRKPLHSGLGEKKKEK